MARGYGFQVGDAVLITALGIGAVMLWNTAGKGTAQTFDAIGRVSSAAATTTTDLLTLPKNYWNEIQQIGFNAGQTVRGWFA